MPESDGVMRPDPQATVQPHTMTAIQIGDHKIRLVKAINEDEPELHKRKWWAYCVEYSGEKIPAENRAGACGDSFYQTAARAIDVYGRKGSDTDAGE
jgi:hypothetical protein